MQKLIVVLIVLALAIRLSAQQKADLIIHNGKIATMVKPNEFEEAVAMKGGIILAIGNSKKILSEFKSSNTIVD
jgi:predicted amidohydrolase YtcJ